MIRETSHDNDRFVANGAPLTELEMLRMSLGERTLSRDVVSTIVGRLGLVRLRQQYFPSWRPAVVSDPEDATISFYRSVEVDDGFEADVVRAVAPAGAKLAVRVSNPTE